MQLTPRRTAQVTGFLLLVAAVTQAIYTVLFFSGAKVLLAFALIVFGLAGRKTGSQLLGGASVVVGFVALVSNTASMAAGRDVFGELPLAGGSGVMATVLLAVFLLTLPDTAAEGN